VAATLASLRIHLHDMFRVPCFRHRAPKYDARHRRNLVHNRNVGAALSFDSGIDCPPTRQIQLQSQHTPPKVSKKHGASTIGGTYGDNNNPVLETIVDSGSFFVIDSQSVHDRAHETSPMAF